MATDRAKYVPKPWAEVEASGLQLVADVLIGGKYRLIRPAGFGGMGAVWVARNEATGADVALKVLRAEDASSEEANARFRREAHAAAKLSHRGIIRVFDLVELEGEHKGSLVMVMELLRGETLADVFDKRPNLEVRESVEIAMALLSALAHAHAAGIVHRDLKPENIFLSVDPDGHTTPKILDFGISKLSAPEAPKITGDGALLGTPSYMSPEQARGASDVDARSDVFTMGILLYEMVSGRNPFASGSYHSVVAAILEREPDPLVGLPPALWQVMLKALKKRPDERYQTAAELALALREATGVRGSLPGMNPSTPPPMMPVVINGSSSVHVSDYPEEQESTARRFQPTIIDERTSRRRRSNRRAAFVIGLIGLLIFAGVLAARMHLRGAARAAPPPLAATAPTAPAAPAVPGAGPVPAPATTPMLEVESLPVAPALAPNGASIDLRGAIGSAPASSVAQGARHSRTPRKPRAASPPAPRDAPAPAPLASSPEPAKPSTVVRDPGF